MKSKNDFSIESILPIVVILLSLLNILDKIENLISLSVLTSLIGITGAILFFYKNPFSTKLIYTWIIVQIIVIDPFFDLSQNFSAKFGFFSETKNGDISINVNFLAIAMLGGIKILEAANLVGKTITLKKFRDNELGNVFPINGIITQRIALGNEPNWVLVELEQSFNYGGKIINLVLIKRKDEKTIKLKDKNQIAFLRVVYDENDLKNTTDNSKFPFIDWIRCE